MLVKFISFSAASLLLLTPSGALASPKPVIEELLKANKTLGGQTVIYPEGTPEMRVYRITLAPGAKIPLHTHPSPVIVYTAIGAAARNDSNSVSIAPDKLEDKLDVSIVIINLLIIN
mgnify:CR=1 FL=1